MRERFVPWSGSVSQWANWLSCQDGELEIWVRIPAKAQILSLKIIICMKPCFDYAIRHSRFPQSCRHIFMNLRRRHLLLQKVFYNSSFLNHLHSVLTLHLMSFKHLLRSNTYIHRLATWHTAITHIKDLCARKSIFLFN